MGSLVLRLDAHYEIQINRYNCKFEWVLTQQFFLDTLKIKYNIIFTGMGVMYQGKQWHSQDGVGVFYVHKCIKVFDLVITNAGL